MLIFNNSYNQHTPLNLAVSRDGEHFKIFKTLDDAACCKDARLLYVSSLNRVSASR